MNFALRFRSAVLLAATAAAGPAFAQASPPGAMPLPGMPTEVLSAPGMTTDPFSGGAYAVPTGAPIAVAYGDPIMSSGPTLSGPTTSGGPVYMAPQVIGGGMMPTMPGSPGCNCGPGGAPTFDPSMMGGTAIGPSYGMPMSGMPMGSPSYGGMPGYGDPNCGMPSTGCCLTDCCLLGGCLDGLCSPCTGAYDPCGTACPPVCDPCQQPGVVPQGGIYHGAGGAQRCGWATGFSWVFLKPFYGSNEAFTVSQGSGFGDSSTVARDFDHSLDLSPRVFVEYVGRSDTGIRATWFGFHNNADSISETVTGTGFGSTPLDQFATNGQTISAESEMDLDTIDLDLTHRLRIRKWLLNLGGGLRWASYDHDYRSAVSGVFGSTGAASRQFTGFGPTLFAELRRPIGTSQFSLLANVRGSMLYGEGESESVVAGQSPFGAGFVTQTTRAESDDFVATAESQLGVEWSAWVSQRSVLFVQTALETQYWLGIGTAHDRNDDLGLFGFNTTVGLEW